MSKRSAIVNLCLCVLAYFALWLLVPRATFLPEAERTLSLAVAVSGGVLRDAFIATGAALSAAPMAVFMLVQLGIVFFYSAIPMKWWQALLALAISIALTVGFMALVVWQSGVPAKMHHWPTIRQSLYIVGVFPSALKMPMYTLLIITASSVGYLVSLRVKEGNLLIPVVMLAAWIDFWTVTRGPVSAVLQKAPEVVNAVAAPIPHAGTGVFIPSTMIGPGDFLFAALVFAAVNRMKMSPGRNFWFVYVAMSLGMLAVMMQVVPYLPALIVLAVAVVAANWRRFTLTRQEMGYLAVVAAALVGLTLILSSAFARK